MASPATRSWSEVASLPSYSRCLPAIAKILAGECGVNDRKGNNVRVCAPGHEAHVEQLTVPENARVSIMHTLLRLCKYTQCSPRVFVAMAELVDRVRQAAQIVLRSDNVHQVVVGCFILASKVVDDVLLTNALYARITGFELGYINEIERVLLSILDWNLHFDPRIHDLYVAELSAAGPHFPTPPAAPAAPASRRVFTKALPPLPPSCATRSASPASTPSTSMKPVAGFSPAPSPIVRSLKQIKTSLAKLRYGGTHRS